MKRLLIAGLILMFPTSALAWGNGQSGNAATNEPQECASPPYSTHDWVADHALTLLPDDEKAWLIPHRHLYLLGTEAPDNRHIPVECGAPNTGYDDRSSGHSVDWAADMSGMTEDRAARRAQEEYSKALIAYEQGNHSAAAFYLGAMAHYIGDVSQYGHSYRDEEHHSDYEGLIGRRTDAFDAGEFESHIVLDSLVRRRPYTAVKRVSKVTRGGHGAVFRAVDMDASYSNRDDDYWNSVGSALNVGVNELTDVLHTFYLNVVEEG